MKSEKIIISYEDEETKEIVEQYPKTVSTQVYVEQYAKYLNDIIGQVLEQSGGAVSSVEEFRQHLIDINNPHKVTKEQIGLGKLSNVDYTELATFNNFKNLRNNPHNVTKSQVGLGSVSNYAVATSEQAKYGTADNLYVTPFGVKALLDYNEYLINGGNPTFETLSVGGSTKNQNGGGVRSNSVFTYSLAIGTANTISATYSFASGMGNTVSKQNSLAIGNGNTINANESFAMGTSNTVGAGKSLAVGASNTVASTASQSFVTGYNNQVKGTYSNGLGNNLIVPDMSQTVVGRYNRANTTGSPISPINTNDLFVVGAGAFEEVRTNAFRVTYSGQVYTTYAYNSSGADYAEFFEWKDGNPENEDRVGYVVTLDGDKIRKATSKDNYILGIVSATPSVVGDSGSEDWKERFLKDEWGRTIYEDVTLEENGETITIKAPKQNPLWDSESPYVPREKRKEWGAVGLMGKLLVRSDGTCKANGFAKVGEDGILTFSPEETNIRVMQTNNGNIVKVFIK